VEDACEMLTRYSDRVRQTLHAQLPAVLEDHSCKA
jgi:hypothetical protein